MTIERMIGRVELLINHGNQQLHIRAPFFILINTIKEFAEDYFSNLPAAYYLNHASLGTLPEFYRLGELFNELTVVTIEISDKEVVFTPIAIARIGIRLFEKEEDVIGQRRKDLDIIYPFVDIRMPDNWDLAAPSLMPTIKYKEPGKSSQLRLDSENHDFYTFVIGQRELCLPSCFYVDEMCIALDAENTCCGFRYEDITVAGAIQLKNIEKFKTNIGSQPFCIEFLEGFEVSTKSIYFAVDVEEIVDFEKLSSEPLLVQYRRMLESECFKIRCKQALYEACRTNPDLSNSIELIDDYYSVVIKKFTFDPLFSLYLSGGQIEANTDPNKYRRQYFPDLLKRIDEEYFIKEHDKFQTTKVRLPDFPLLSARSKWEERNELTSNQIFDEISGNLFLISIQLINDSRPISKEIFSSFYHTGTFVDGKQFSLTFNQRFVMPIKYRDIPSGTQMCLTLWLFDKSFLDNYKLSHNDILLFNHLMYESEGSAPLDNFDEGVKEKICLKDDLASLMKAGFVPIGAVIQDIFDREGLLICGAQQLSLYPDITHSQLATFSIYQQNIIRPNSNKLSYNIPILGCFKLTPHLNYNESIFKVEDNVIPKLIEKYVNNPLLELTNSDYEELYQNRYVVLQEPSLLPSVLKAIPIERNQYYEQFLFIIRLMRDVDIRIETILELLDYEFSDVYLREMAVDKLKKYSTASLALFIPQLIEILKFEKSHDLEDYLLQIAVENYDMFGWNFFWNVKSQMRHSFGYFYEYETILLDFLSQLPKEQRDDLLLAEEIADFLMNVAENVAMIKETTSGKIEVQLEYLQQEMNNLNKELQESGVKHFKTPLSNTIQCISVLADKCRIMDSKKAPLMLFLERYNSDSADDYAIMAKNGDDLREDALTIEILQVFDVAWKRARLQTILQPYAVVPTGPDEGFIEIVRDAETLARITAQHGATGAFKKTPILEWLDKEKSKSNTMMQICERFYKSTAAYCVATYILGIGDRHNDNVMLTRQGEFFHIDFGHFLGNFKKKFGIEREKAPFFFTPDLKFVMEQCDLDLKMNSYESFIQLCEVAYNEARKQGTLLIVMMKMMCNTGIAELGDVSDLGWLIDTLLLNSTDEQASRYFAKYIKEAVNSIATQFNNYCHIIAHE